MNRIVDIGRAGSAYFMQPRILPGVLPNILSHPSTIYSMQPHVAASIYQMQPNIPATNHYMQPEINPEAYQMQPEINPNTFDDIDLLSEPVNFNRPLDRSPETFYNRPITGTEPRFYNRIVLMGRPVTFNIIPDDEDETTDTPIIETTTDWVSTVAPLR